MNLLYCAGMKSLCCSVLFILAVIIPKQKSQHHNNHVKHTLEKILDVGQTDLKIITDKYNAVIKHFGVPIISEESLTTIFDDIHNGHLTYFVIDTYQNANEFYHFSDAVDKALIPRPWIMIKKFVFKLNKDSAQMIHHIIFEKLNDIIGKDMQLIAENNYPATQEICASRPFAIAWVIGDTWGNRAYNIASWMGSTTKYAKYFWNHLDVPYNTHEECTNRVNKYECIFLASTNCSIPIRFLNGTDILGPRGDRLYYTKAASDGEIINDFHTYTNDVLKNRKSYEISSTMVQSEHLSYSLHPKDKYIITGIAPQIINETTNVEMRSIEISPQAIKNVFGFFHRPNTEFRFKIQHYVDKFRASTHPSFISDQTCVFAHIRKDDRSVPHVDMIDWCKKHTILDSVTGKYKVQGKRDGFDSNPTGDVDPGLWGNLGCEMGLPYGAISLEHMINATLMVSPLNKNIFLATDDDEWLAQAMLEYQEQEHNLISKHNLNLYTFHARHGHRQAFSMDVAAEFFATIEVGQQCNGFVGFRSCSAVANLFYQSMCYNSHYEYLKCPPLYDLCSRL